MSFEIMRSELDLFKKTQFQSSIEDSQFVEVRPISSVINANTIDFEINSSPDEYLDLQNIYLFVTAKITDSAGTSYVAAEDDKYSIVNYALNCMFDQLTIYLGGTLISQATNTYNYLSYIEALLENSLENCKTLLRSAGFFDNFATASYDAEAIDANLHKLVKRSKLFTLYGKLHGGIFKCDRLLINGIPMHLTLNLASSNLVLRSTAAANGTLETTSRLNLLNFSLFVRKVKLVPSLLNAHAKILANTKALYPIKRPVIKTLNLPKDQSTFNFDNVFMGQMPSRVVFGLVSNDAFSGSRTKNPFAFKHFDLTFVAIHLNGEMIPKTPYTPDFRDGQDRYEREYYDFLLNLGYDKTDTKPAISFENYKKAYCLFVFNLNSDFENPDENDYINIPKEGFLNIDIKFRADLTTALKLIVYAQFDNIIEIDESRNVTVDYS